MTEEIRIASGVLDIGQVLRDSVFDRAASAIHSVALAGFALSRIGIPIEKISQQLEFHRNRLRDVLRSAMLAESDPLPSEAYFEYMVGLKESDLAMSQVYSPFVLKVWKEFQASGKSFQISPEDIDNDVVSSVRLGHLLCIQQGRVADIESRDDEDDDKGDGKPSSPSSPNDSTPIRKTQPAPTPEPASV